MSNSFADTTIQQAQANTLAAIKIQVVNLNTVIKGNYLTAFSNWTQTGIGGVPAGDPPKPPNAFVVGYFTDPTTGPGSGGAYGDTPYQWAYPAVGKEPVCDMPPLPTVITHPPGYGLIGKLIYGEWFQALEGDTTPAGTAIPGTSKDGVVGLFLKVASPVGGGWYQKVG